MSKWMIPADQLDNDQQTFMFEELSKPDNKWIKGFAGSGKSVLLIHAIAERVRKEPEAQILLVHFYRSLQSMYQAGISELNIPDRNIYYVSYIHFQKDPRVFDYIYCDEVQDLTPEVLDLMKNNCRQLIVSGDPHQSIYDKDPKTKRPVVSVEQIAQVCSAKEFPLKTVHRLTKSVLNLISSLIPTMGILKAKKNDKKVDVTVRKVIGNNKYEEVEYILKQAKEAISIEETAAVLLPTHQDILQFVGHVCNLNETENWSVTKTRWGNNDYTALNNYFYRNNIHLHYLGNGHGNLMQASNQGKLIIMTYHSSKGIDFDNVYLPFLDQNANIKNETLFMVALSRSKGTLILTHSESTHDYLEKIKEQCHCLDLNKNDEEDSDFEFEF